MIKLPPHKEWFRPSDVAEYFCIARGTIYLWIESGKIDAIRINDDTLRIHRKEIERIIQKSSAE